MIVRRLQELQGTDREVDEATWTSRRLLLAGDGMGFSLHDTLIKAGTTTEMWYKHHVEAVYCIEGEGTIATADGERFELSPGTVYALDGHEKHTLTARTQMRMVCVFNPPVTGREVHGPDGAYPLPEALAQSAAAGGEAAATCEPLSVSDDVYPSRVEAEPSWLPRVDPVVYGDPAVGGVLTAEQVAGYERDGYLFLERFFDPAEVEEYRAAMRRMWAEAERSDAPEVIREPDSRTVRSIFAVHRQGSEFAALANHPKLQAIVTGLLGGDVYVHQSRINYKPGFDGKEFYWHSDFETWHVEDGMPRMRALSVSIALEDNYAYNGPLMIVPGSHKTFVSCVGRTPERHFQQSLRRQQYGVPDRESLAKLVAQGGIEAPAGAAGSVVLFDCNVMHGSNGNITPMPRSNVFMVFNSVSNRLQTPYSGQQPRPGYIADR